MKVPPWIITLDEPLNIGVQESRNLGGKNRAWLVQGSESNWEVGDSLSQCSYIMRVCLVTAVWSLTVARQEEEFRKGILGLQVLYQWHRTPQPTVTGSHAIRKGASARAKKNKWLWSLRNAMSWCCVTCHTVGFRIRFVRFHHRLWLISLFTPLCVGEIGEASLGWEMTSRHAWGFLKCCRCPKKAHISLPWDNDTWHKRHQWSIGVQSVEQLELVEVVISTVALL